MRYDPGKSIRVSDAVRRLNPEVFGRVGGLEATVDQSKPRRTLVQDLPARQKSSPRLGYRVTLTAVIRRRMDSDNLIRGLKPLRDAIAATLGIDDGSDSLVWEYGQCESAGAEGVIVKLERS